MALTSGRMFRGMISAWTTSCRMPAISRLLWRAEGPCRSMVAAPPQVAAGDIAGDIDWTEDMAVPVKRRVAALRQLQSDYDALQKQFIKERAELQAKYEQQADPLMDKRESIIAGAAAVNKFDVDDSDEPDEGIPDFWLTAITNHEMVGEYVTEKDAEVLSYLTDVRVSTLTDDKPGSFRIEFRFRQNPFFTNKVLEKTFYMENPDEIVPDRFIGCTIDWQPGKDTTVATVQRQVRDKKKKGSMVTISQTKPTNSFFNFFKTADMPENPDDLSEEQLETLQQQMDEDYEIAIAFKESLVPRAVEWFTGEAAPPLYDDEYEDDREYGEIEDEEAGLPPQQPPQQPPRRR
eukprot:GHRR01007104.1.p1 GENE.GHRR01007104.1~~GHRR01007104.1.p1  ORF type:complete len:348 (+),score=127.01 GHRR01007104.1:91-1134(+)